jgi:hypothetical protein
LDHSACCDEGGSQTKEVVKVDVASQTKTNQTITVLEQQQ